MARPRSAKISDLKHRLVSSLQTGLYSPGKPFMSARALAGRYEISYQTAHRLLVELETEGYLKRSPASGTQVAGKAPLLDQVHLFFHPRAAKPESFGSRLLQLLTDELKWSGIRYKLSSKDQSLGPKAYPVIWELPRLALRAADQQRHALLLLDRPAPGIGTSFVDSISTDDFSGGVCAGEVLRRYLPRGARPSFLAGPRRDRRSQRRVEGFLSIFPAATGVYAANWYYLAGMRAAPSLLKLKPPAIFCGNDRLAEAVLDFCRKQKQPPPFLIGFDDAPVDQERDLTTIALPWQEIVSEAVQLIKYRLQGGTSPARQIILSSRPVIRTTRPSL